jgi:hypothetical protein
MILPLVWTLVGTAQGGDAEPSLADVPMPSRCLEDRATMRFSHMTLLREQRDRVVRDGRRAELAPALSGALAECLGCHADRTAFCDRCHQRAGVRLDCFECHAE